MAVRACAAVRSHNTQALLGASRCRRKRMKPTSVLRALSCLAQNTALVAAYPEPAFMGRWLYANIPAARISSSTRLSWRPCRHLGHVVWSMVRTCFAATAFQCALLSFGSLVSEPRLLLGRYAAIRVPGVVRGSPCTSGTILAGNRGTMGEAGGRNSLGASSRIRPSISGMT